jgi:hypothetical protein
LKRRPKPIFGLPPNGGLTAMEYDLKNTILADPRAKKAYENLVRNGYRENTPIIHLNMWARTPAVLTAESLAFKIPNRKAKNKILACWAAIIKLASEIESNPFLRSLSDNGVFARHWIIKEKGAANAAECIERLPETLRLYSEVLRFEFSVESNLSKHFDKSHREYEVDQAMLFVNEVKKRTGKDRIDIVVELFRCVAQYFGHKRSFEKKALSQQLQRLRQRSAVSPPK